MRMLEKQYGAYHLIETLVKSCYDDVDDGRREGKEGEKKEEKEKEDLSEMERHARHDLLLGNRIPLLLNS